MHIRSSAAIALPLLLALTGAHAAEPGAAAGQPAATTEEDQRQLVEMPAQARRFLQADMLDHLAALNQIIGLLAEGQFEQAGEVAEQRMGRSSMGRHRGTGMGPGRFMPAAMRNIGWSMHDAASEFATATEQGDERAAYRALQGVTNACVACHSSYRIR